MAGKRIKKQLLIFFLLLSSCTTRLAPFNPGAFNNPVKNNTPEVINTPITSETEDKPPGNETNIPDANATDAPLIWLETSTPAVIGLMDLTDGINPLTASAVEKPENLNRRPLLIKVSNYPRSGRPHAGLSFADIVFEYYIGEEMNRFLAVFYSQNSPQIGPLRSGRLIDTQLTTMYGGFLVYGGADPKVDTNIINVLHERAFTHNSSPCPPICGDDTHSVSGVFVDSGAMTKYINRKGIENPPPDLEGLVFDQQPPVSDQFAVKIGVEYSFRNRGEWHYDTESGTYFRWIEEDDEYTMIPLVDRVNNQQIKFDNVIVLFVTYVEYAPTLHDVLVWENVDGNKAYVFRDGMMTEGTWKVPDHEQPIHLYNKYGLPLALKPGNSWYVFVGQRSTIDNPQEGQWEFHFELP